MDTYLDKFNNAIKNTVFYKLPQDEQEFIKEKSLTLKFTLNEIRQIIDIARDLNMWGEDNIIGIFPDHDQKKVVFTRLRKLYEQLRSLPNSYENFVQ